MNESDSTKRVYVCLYGQARSDGLNLTAQRAHMRSRSYGGGKLQLISRQPRDLQGDFTPDEDIILITDQNWPEDIEATHKAMHALEIVGLHSRSGTWHDLLLEIVGRKRD